MPIYRFGEVLLYFSHIPKTGGSSIEEHLLALGGVLAFRDTRWATRPRPARWTATSPQHISAADAARLFPAGFFDHSFAVVRHPEARILSEYHFQRGKSKRAVFPAFADWLRRVCCSAANDPFFLDGHIRPQVDFVADGMRVFKLEDGLQDVANWIQMTLGAERTVAFNITANISQRTQAAVARCDREIINDFYRSDFERFGYEPAP